jgi:hypothetical protein
MDPARMFKESLTSRPELENSQGQSRPNWAVCAMSGLPPIATGERTSRLALSAMKRLSRRNSRVVDQLSRAALAGNGAAVPGFLRPRTCQTSIWPAPFTSINPTSSQ